MSEESVIIDHIGTTLVLTMRNPGRRNAFHPEMRERMCEAFRSGADDPAVTAFVITGADGHFCAGTDMRRLDESTDPAADVADRIGSMHTLLRHIVAGRKPVVAAVEGDAFGAGLSMAAAADLMVCGRSARFGASFVKVGMYPDMGLMHTLPARIGTQPARRLMMTAQTIAAEAAVEIGLADELTETGGARERALSLAEGFAQCAPLSIAAVKFALIDGPLTMEAALELELRHIPKLLVSEDHQAARSAFLTKTPVRFRGR